MDKGGSNQSRERDTESTTSGVSRLQQVRSRFDTNYDVIIEKDEMLEQTGGT